LRDLESPERDFAVIAQAVEENVAEALELVDQNVIPEGGEFVVGDGGFGHDGGLLGSVSTAQEKTLLPGRRRPQTYYFPSRRARGPVSGVRVILAR
jgi:hypothetical protein